MNGRTEEHPARADLTGHTSIDDGRKSGGRKLDAECMIFLPSIFLSNRRHRNRYGVI